MVGQQLTQTGYPPVCLPSDIPTSQVQLIVQKAIREHPEILNLNGVGIVTRALRDAYTCKPGQVPPN
jgi:hypothetical protein